MITNKHLILALIMTPFLAIGAWYAVGLVVKERPQSAVAGQSYPLSAKSNCRYTSGVCDLVNADFKSRLVVVKESGTQILQLSSSHSLQGAKVGFRSAAKDGSLDEILPMDMRPSNEDRTGWEIEVPIAITTETELILALTSQGSHYYAQTTMGFSEYQTIFDKEYVSD